MLRPIVVLAPFGLRPKATLSRRALPLLSHLAAQGLPVHILAPPDLYPADAGLMTQIDGVTVEHGPWFGVGTPAMVRSVRWMLSRTLALEPSLVHLFKPKGYGGIAATLLRRIRPALPLVLDTDDWEGTGGWNDRLPYSRSIKALINWLERTLPRMAHAVTAASRTLESQVVGYRGHVGGVTYLPNGVALPGRALPPRSIARQRLGLDTDTPTLLLYTRFWEFDVTQVAALLVGLASQMPTARLLVIGAGEHGEEEDLARLAARAGVAHLLDQRGWADESLIAAALAAADVALYPMDDTLLNRAKCSAKLTEQMQAALPIVAARVGQVAEYIEDERSGLLVAPGDGGALAAGALCLLREPATAHSLGLAARTRIEERFAWPLLADRLWHQVYAPLLAPEVLP